MSSLQATVISGLFSFQAMYSTKARLAATGRPLEHDRHAHVIGGGEFLDLVADGPVIGFRLDAELLGIDIVMVDSFRSGHLVLALLLRRGRAMRGPGVCQSLISARCTTIAVPCVCLKLS
jgi:hypothetical protein